MREMEKPRILVVDDFSQGFIHNLAKYAEVIKVPHVDDAVSLRGIAFLIIRSKTRVDKTLVDRMPNLKCVISATHGKDHICTNYLREKGVRFHNVSVQSYDVAQGVMAYILAHSTNLVIADRMMKREEWKKELLKGCRLKGKTIGIIGYGRTGRKVATLAAAFGMNILAYDPRRKRGEFAVTLNELLERSDIITLHTPLTKKTKGMIGRDEICRMRDGAFLINTARSRIIDEEGLLDALRKGKLGGAALDVYEREPPFKNKVSSKLIQDDRVIATPHSIAQTAEAMEDKEERVLRIIRNYLLSCNAENGFYFKRDDDADKP
jgi:D-3-phosphoglycerate dehydrogenase